jgi:aspartate kinase
LTRGLQALEANGMACLGAAQGPRNVDVQFILNRDDLGRAVKALHGGLIGAAQTGKSPLKTAA